MSEFETIKEYIHSKEKNTLVGSIDAIKEEFNSLVGKEVKETRDGLHLFEWLKNDKNLLKYAEIKTKEGELSRGDKFVLELLELKLAITCPYFADFKDFLEELKKGEHVDEGNQVSSPQNPEPSQGTTTSPSTTQNNGQHPMTYASQSAPSRDIPEKKGPEHKFCGISVGEIQSYPFYKNSSTGITRCSATARMNGQNFGMDLPHGDAYNAGIKPGKDALATLPKNKKNKKPLNKWPSLKISEFKSTPKKINFADIYVESKSNYGHRAIAFRDSTGQRYVLDPYTRVNGDLDNTPKKLEDYLSTRKIVKSHFYKSNTYDYKNLSYT